MECLLLDQNNKQNIISNVLLEESNYSIFEYNIPHRDSPNRDIPLNHILQHRVMLCWTIKLVSVLLLAIKYNAILCHIYRQDEYDKCIPVSDGHSLTV